MSVTLKQVIRFIFFIITALLLINSSYAIEGDHCNQALNNILSSLKSGKSVDFEALSYSEAKTKKLLAMKQKEPVEKVITSHNDRQDIIYVYGVPKKLERIEHEGKVVFRHYTNHSLDQILNSNTLKSGPRPFIDPTPHARWEYQDLTGPMFTKPAFNPKDLWMDVTEKSDWVDFTVDAKVPVLLCKDGNYLIPLQRNYPDWIRKDYEQFINTGKSSYRLEEDFIKIQAEGGMLPQQEIPIKINAYQKDGKIHDLK